jgi:hypothetical protein
MVDQHVTSVRAADERGADGMRQRPDRPSPPLAQERPTIVWVAIGEEGWGDPPVNGITMITVNSAQRYWVDAQGNFGVEGGMMIGNLWLLAQQRLATRTAGGGPWAVYAGGGVAAGMDKAISLRSSATSRGRTGEATTSTAVTNLLRAGQRLCLGARYRPCVVAFPGTTPVAGGV